MNNILTKRINSKFELRIFAIRPQTTSKLKFCHNNLE